MMELGKEKACDLNSKNSVTGFSFAISLTAGVLLRL